MGPSVSFSVNPARQFGRCVELTLTGVTCPCGKAVTAYAYYGKLSPQMKKMKMCEDCRFRKKVMSSKI